MPLIEGFDQTFVLGVASMDATHREFVDRVNRLGDAGDGPFAELFADLVAHTRAHFQAEEELMAATGFPATAEHRADHARVLGDLERLLERLALGRTRLARAYVAEHLPDWFALHARTMNSALALHLTNGGRAPVSATR